MKTIKLFIITALALTILTACGGGSSDKKASVAATPSTPSSPDRATNPVNPTSPSPTSPTTDSTELVIDNGRGTTNGHDTEQPK